jgi:hypothetical protein
MGAGHKPHQRLHNAELASSSLRRSPEPRQAPILVTETPETTIPLSPSNASILRATSAGELQSDRHHLISNRALQHAIKHCLEDISGLLKATNFDSESRAAMGEQLDQLSIEANGVNHSDLESLKKLRTDVLMFFSTSLLPHITRENKNALPSIDHLPERLVETVGALLSSHQFEGLTTSGEKAQLSGETSASTRLIDLNLILNTYSARINQYAHPNSMASMAAPGLVHIHWPADQGMRKEIKAIVLSTSGGLAEQETAHKAARAMEPNSPIAVRVAPIRNEPGESENHPSLHSSVDRKQGMGESDATHKLLAYIEQELKKNNVNPQNAKGYVEAPLRLPISLTHATAIADFNERWPQVEVYPAPQIKILHRTEVQDWDHETELTRNRRRQVFDMPDGNVCMSALHYQDVSHRRSITEQAKLELAASLNIDKDKIKFQAFNEKPILSNEVTVEKVKGDYAFIAVPGQRHGGERVYIKATFAELRLRTIKAGQKISLDRTRRVSRPQSPKGAGNPPPPTGPTRK